MAALFLKRLTLQTIKTESGCVRSCFGKYMAQQTALAQLPLLASTPRVCCVVYAQAFSTAKDPHSERTKKKKKKEKTDFGSIGRKIHDRVIHVVDEQGNDLGNMHRANVIQLLDERGLRLVPRNTSTEPPKYQLMTGLQIHQERLQLREMEKAKRTTCQTLTKELTFSSSIGQHDLCTKSKQIQQWLEKKYKVQITVKEGRNKEEPANKMEEIFDQLLQMMPGIATFLSRPQPTKGGKALMCVLRCLTQKEEKAYRETQMSQNEDTLNKEHGKDRDSDTLHQ